MSAQMLNCNWTKGGSHAWAVVPNIYWLFYVLLENESAAVWRTSVRHEER